MEYRVTYKVNGSAVNSESYYSVFHSSEALLDLLHTLRKGSVHGDNITIFSIEEFCPYRRDWLDRTEKALQSAGTENLSVHGKNIQFNKDALPESI